MTNTTDRPEPFVTETLVLQDAYCGDLVAQSGDGCRRAVVRVIRGRRALLKFPRG